MDNESKYETAKIAANLGAEVHYHEGYLGTVRYRQAQLADTEWMASIDSDIYVYPNWWDEVSQYVGQPDVAAINGFCGCIITELPEYDQLLKYVAIRHPRFNIGNTLVRRELILRCTELLNHVGYSCEEGPIGARIKQEGLRLIKIPRVVSFHDKDPYVSGKYSYRRIVEDRRRMFGLPRALVEVPRLLAGDTYCWLEYSVGTHRFNLTLYFFLLRLSCYAFRGLFIRPPKRTM